jgi:hypothetical protein
MPSFFQFTQGTESRVRLNTDSSPLLGRFRAVPPRPELGRRRSSQLGLLSSYGRGSIHVGYGAILAELGDDSSDSDEELEDEEDAGRGMILWRRSMKRFVDLWVEPRQSTVRKVVDVWWSRYAVLVVLPAVLVSTRATRSGQCDGLDIFLTLRMWAC